MSESSKMSKLTSNPCPEFSTGALPKIPESIIEEILFLLPVKSIFKFRCVSPSWCSLLDSQYFLKKYLSKATKKIILNTPNSFYHLDISKKTTPGISALKLCYQHSNTFILGSCNGLILSHHDNNTPQERWDVVLQNPYNRSFEKIPYELHKFPGPKNIVCAAEKFIYGIWYDDLADDYKVLRNVQFYGTGSGEPFYSQANVYSLKMKSWKMIDPFPYYVKHEMAGNVATAGMLQQFGIGMIENDFSRGIVEDMYEMPENALCGGALHWVVGTSSWDKSQWIGAFDVVTEKWRLIEQPLYSGVGLKLNVHVLGGCLSVVCSYFPIDCFDVWVMKEYGNVASWSKQVFIRGADIGVESFGYLKPLIYSECGKQVLIERGCRTLLWYDIEKMSAEIVELDKHLVPKHFQAFVHMESLVKLSCRCPGDENKEAAKMPKAKKRDDFLSKGFKLKL